MEIPIEWEGHDTAQTNPPETWLLPDDWELQERYEQQSAGKVSHSGESFTLTLIINLVFTVQLQPSTQCFSISRRVMTACFCRSKLPMKLPATIANLRKLLSYIQNTPSE